MKHNRSMYMYMFWTLFLTLTHIFDFDHNRNKMNQCLYEDKTRMARITKKSYRPTYIIFYTFLKIIHAKITNRPVNLGPRCFFCGPWTPCVRTGISVGETPSGKGRGVTGDRGGMRQQLTGSTVAAMGRATAAPSLPTTAPSLPTTAPSLTTTAPSLTTTAPYRRESGESGESGLEHLSPSVGCPPAGARVPRRGPSGALKIWRKLRMGVKGWDLGMGDTM